jgi:hypothetical protein
MESLIESISEFVSKLIVTALIGGSIFLFAGEIRLAALKKAAHGSSRLSDFTAKMTKMNVTRAYGGQHGAGKKSH